MPETSCFHVSSNVGAYRYTLCAARRNSSGGIPPGKWRPLVYKSCTSGAIWRIEHAQVVPPGGQDTN